MWLYSQPTDMRKSIDGLSTLVSEHLNKNPCGPDVFVFHNRGKNKLKILYWHKNGFCLWYKRLEKGTFFLPVLEASCYGITMEQLRWLLDGLNIDLIKGHPDLVYDTYF
jgi:transposase